MKAGMVRFMWCMLATACAMALPSAAAHAQNRETPQAASGACPALPGATAHGANTAALGAQPVALPGFWALTLWPTEGTAASPISVGTLLLEPHPEYPGSVRGSLRRNEGWLELRAWVSGDLNDGLFLLDESEDGVAMSAVWEGELSAAACGQEIQGLRRTAEGTPHAGQQWHFRLRRSTQLR